MDALHSSPTGTSVMCFAKFFPLISLLIASILSNGCQSEKPIPDNNLNVNLPASFTTRALTGSCADNIWADVLIDNQAPQKLQKTTGSWQGTIKLTPGAHTLKIEFKCTTDNFGAITLATYEEDVNLSGDESLNLSSDRYDYPDNDQDGHSNLAEIEAGTDPGSASNGFAWANPLPQGESLMDVIWDGNEFLAVGVAGTILTSGDGQSWSFTRSASSNFLKGVAWSGTQYVIVGHDGVILSRAGNDTDWTARDSGSKRHLQDITWTGSLFVAVGDQTVVTSADGIHWTPHDIPGVVIFNSITWTGDKLVAAGASENADLKRIEGAIFTSKDGTSWSSPQLTDTPWLFDITWTGSQLVAVGGDKFTADGFRQGGIILTSPNGEDWTKQTSGTGVDLNGVNYDSGNDLIIAVGGNHNLLVPDNPNNSIILSSVDGVNWVSKDASQNQTYRSIASSTNQTIVVGDAGVIKSSKDLGQWTNHTGGTLNSIMDMVSMDDQVVAVGENGEVLTSQDGLSWASRSSGITTNLWAVTWTGSQLVAVGGELDATQHGVIATSPDGISWTDRTPAGSFGLMKDVIWTGSQLVAVGVKGLILTSPNGIDWTSRNSGINNFITGVSFNGNQIVAIGSPTDKDQGAALTSSDGGISWIKTSDLDHKTDLFSLTWIGSFFIAAGGNFSSTTGAEKDAGIIVTSPDAINWTSINPGVDSVLLDVEWTGSQILAVADHSYLLSSTDNTSWTVTPTISSNGHNSVFEYQGTTLIGGGNGMILYRTD